MPLSALSSYVYSQYAASFPAGVAVLRANPAGGVPPHNPSHALITALCSGVVSVLSVTPFQLVIAGAADPVGTPVAPIPVTFPGRSASVASFLASQGWAGPQGALAANVFVGAVLDGISLTGLMTLSPSLVVGTGQAVLNPGLNAALLAPLTSGISAAILAALQGGGCFGTGDVAGAPVNPVMAARIPLFAQAYASALVTAAGTGTYVGTAATTVPATGPVTGVFA